MTEPKCVLVSSVAPHPKPSVKAAQTMLYAKVAYALIPDDASKMQVVPKIDPYAWRGACGE